MKTNVVAKPGETWRRLCDSLRLFTPSQNDKLPGMKFYKPDFYFPTRDEVSPVWKYKTYKGKAWCVAE